MRYPVQPWNRYKVDSIFIDPAYCRRFKAWHSGWDINARTGGDTDYGHSIYSVYGGFVSDVKVGQDSWGLIVRVWHPGLNVFTRYAHCAKAIVTVGYEVKEGEKIATIGNANGRRTTHLHFDIMKDLDKPFDYWKVGVGQDALNDCLATYIDPKQFFKKWAAQ